MGQPASFKSFKVWTLEFGTGLVLYLHSSRSKLNELQLPELSAVLSLLCASGGCYLLRLAMIVNNEHRVLFVIIRMHQHSTHVH